MENRISLIIPAYNEEKYIGDCLKAVFETHRNSFFEIIVIDNASTDKTAEIASSFGVKVFQENKKGVVRARQKGYLEAKGNILTFIDADTLMPEGWLNVIKNEFEKDKNVVCVSGPYIYYDQSVFLKFLTKLYWYILAIPIYKIVGYMVVAGNVAIKKETLEKTNGLDTSIEFYGDDTNMARNASKYGKVKFTTKLNMFTSNRRLKEEGTLKTTFLYVKNFLSEVIFHKPSNTEEYKGVR